MSAPTVALMSVPMDQVNASASSWSFDVSYLSHQQAAGLDVVCLEAQRTLAR
jgi:hypothetical protein